MELPTNYTLRAHYVFPVEGPPIRDGFVQVQAGRIAAMGGIGQRSRPVLAGEQMIDLGNVAILPGLVNAHVHLEFSDLTTPLGEPGTPLPDWIRLVLAYRRQRPSENYWPNVVCGFEESLAAGTTTLGEIATQVWGLDAAEWTGRISDGAVTAFYELIGRDPQRIAASFTAGRQHLVGDPDKIFQPPDYRPETQLATLNDYFFRKDSAAGMEGVHCRVGLSPHAPYTINALLIEEAVQLAASNQVPLAIHLAESPEEMEWLANGTGKFAELLAEFGGAMAARSSFRSPADVIASLHRAPRVLLIHGNYFDGPTLTNVADQRERFSIVYCPRTHAFFRHAPYPLVEMLRQGINVALGTDGRGSNPDLSILAEMRFVARQHTAVSPMEVLRLGTLGGATALGLAHEIGTLTPGKLANLAVVPLPDGQNVADPHELLFASDQPVSRTIVQGRIVSSTVP